MLIWSIAYMLSVISGLLYTGVWVYFNKDFSVLKRWLIYKVCLVLKFITLLICMLILWFDMINLELIREIINYFTMFFGQCCVLILLSIDTRKLWKETGADV